MLFGSQPNGHCHMCVNIILIPIYFSNGLNVKLHEKYMSKSSGIQLYTNEEERDSQRGLGTSL